MTKSEKISIIIGLLSLILAALTVNEIRIFLGLDSSQNNSGFESQESSQETDTSRLYSHDKIIESDPEDNLSTHNQLSEQGKSEEHVLEDNLEKEINSARTTDNVGSGLEVITKEVTTIKGYSAFIIVNSDMVNAIIKVDGEDAKVIDGEGTTIRTVYFPVRNKTYSIELSNGNLRCGRDVTITKENQKVYPCD